MTLKALEFTDLIIESDSTGGVRSAWYRVTNGDGPRQRMAPAELLPEINGIERTLRASLVAGQKNLALRHDDVPYRVQFCRFDGNTDVWFVSRGMDPLPPLSAFNMPPRMESHLMALGRRNGIILACGPMSSGKTTFLCSLLQSLVSRYGETGITIEDPPELPLQGEYPNNGHIYQWDLTRHSLPVLMEDVLRTRAAYLLIGEIRTAEAAAAAVIASLNGMCVLGSIHADDIRQAMVRLISMATSREGDWARTAIAEGLLASINLHMSRIAGRRSFKITTLVAGDGSCPVRGLIRQNKLEQLPAEVQRQQDAMSNALAV